MQALNLTLTVNGVERQRGNTREMIFDVCFLVHYVSQFMTLEAGDLLSTGTPAGVGLGFKPPIYLREGDEVRLTIDGLGERARRDGAHQDRQGCRHQEGDRKVDQDGVIGGHVRLPCERTNR